MSFWDNVVDVLRSPAFRIGSGVAGLASGAGAFEGLGDWGQGLSGLAGVANLASGAASTFGPGRSDLDKITGGLQMGLGGYNVGQGLGAVGTFGDIFDTISGGSSGGGGTTAIGGGTTTDTFGAGGASGSFGDGGGSFTLGTAPTTDTAFTPPASIGGGGTSTQSLMNPTGAQAYLPPSSYGGDTYTSTIGDQTAQITPGDLVGPGVNPQDLQQPAAPIPPRVGAPVAIPPEPGVQQLPVQGQPGTLQSLPPTTVVGPTPGGPGSPGATVTPAGTLPPSQPIDMQQFGPPSSLAPAAARGDWLDRTWDSLATTAERNPIGAAMTALSIGSMIASQFAGSRSDIARQALTELQNRQPAAPTPPGTPTPPPPMPDSAEFRKLFEEKAKGEIDRMYNDARSSLTARFGSRGMLNSTVYTNALESLDKARIDSTAQLPASSLAAWNQALGEWTRAAAVINQTNQTNMQSADAYNRSLLAYADQQAKNLQTVTSYVNAAVPQTNFADMTRVLAQSPFIQSLAARQQA